MSLMLSEGLVLPRQDQEVVPWVTSLLIRAQQLGASDLHIDPQPQGACLRLRINGLLQDWLDVPPLWQPRLVSRLKVMAQMDLAEKRLPQDGRLGDAGQGLSHIRVASIPTLHGEKLCLRLADAGHTATLAALHLPASTEHALLHHLTRPDGLILITGPTGAGKTTSLYACLQHLNARHRHIATIEDPVERLLPGINQTPIQPRIGLGFAEILKALLRQDPDVLMVGEIRDREAAEMALQAAETGHLVLSTLHSGTAIEALSRLRHLGVPAYLLADSLRLVVTQRLIRRLCDRCKVIDTQHGGFSAGHGCEACQQGHSQRIGLFEHIEMSPALAQLCLSGADRHALQACAVKSGWSSLRAGGEALWQQGSVSRHELHRVLGYEEA
jgi:type II secretory ATPase GspE/PulE/Tfp pilus assembly ATPase PilB-like protein